jgi:acetyl esterase/lipase
MLLTPTELAASAVLHPEIKSFIAANPLPSSASNDHTGIRNGLRMLESRMLSNLDPAPLDVTELYQPITMRDGYINTVKIAKPVVPAAGPLFILGHAGGFVGGSNEQLTSEARALVRLFGATVISVAYRLAPEHKFPTQQLDVWDCCKWISDHAAEPTLNADPTIGFILGGVSVGGSMAAALSRKFQDEPLSYALTGQWLCVASLMDNNCVPPRFKDLFLAREQSRDAPLLNKSSLKALQRLSQ